MTHPVAHPTSLPAEFADWLTGMRSWAAKCRQDDDLWRTAASQGLLSLAVPESAGGTGAGYEAACLALETFAGESGLSGPPFAMAAQMWACQEPLLEFGTAVQHDRYLTPLLAGTAVGAFAATEYESGSDLMSLRTRAERDGAGRWRLNGAKTFITNGPTADVFLVLARTTEGSALSGLTAFVVPLGTPGLHIGTAIKKAGLAGADLGSLHIDDCVLDESDVLGGPGGGFAVLMHAMRHERAFILAPALGLMDRALRRSVEHARSRSQFGQPLASYDTIRRRLVRMHMALTSARELLHTTARRADTGTLDHGRSSLTKLHVSTEFNRFCEELPDVYGGYALLPETGATDLLADAVASRYYSGTSDMQMKIIAEGLGL
ncbi:acyl-CoA dehydrogenase family protein [Streptomyces osmaniensis]|uniref:Isovaleryl-CoA dehydrogenase n=1 Tax=Streptomyces osmaniensis TaxID=593134 RepID=A0ABP6XR84_9ACTN|nr:acyl-CoA dehydrogenase [Streptomyces sp. JCM17656]